MTSPTLLAVIPSLAMEWLFYLAFVGVGLLIYLVGNLLFGQSRAGGERLLVFVFGLALGLIPGFILHYASFPELLPVQILLKAILIGLIAGGVCVMLLAVFGSSDLVERIFQAMIKGL